MSNEDKDKGNGKYFGLGTSTLIHIAAEVLLIAGVGWFFNRKINKLNEEIDELKKVVQQHDQILQQIVTGGMRRPPQQHDAGNGGLREHFSGPHHPHHRHPQQQQLPPQSQPSQYMGPQRPYRPPVQQLGSDSESEEEYEQAKLDQQLTEELNELEAQEEEVEEEEVEEEPARSGGGNIEFISEQEAGRLKRKKHKRSKKKRNSN